jgi:hypothetical protein
VALRHFNRLLAEHHAEQADGRDEWRGGRPYLNKAISHADGETHGERDEIANHDSLLSPVAADPTCSAARDTPSRYVNPRRRLWVEPLCGSARIELLEAANEELRRDQAEAVRVAYVAATRARDLLVPPVCGDEPIEGWLDVLNPVLYPPEDSRPNSDRADGCPSFGFSIAEVDQLIVGLAPEESGDPADEALADLGEVPTRCRLGDIWRMGPQRLICGDALDPSSEYPALRSFRILTISKSICGQAKSGSWVRCPARRRSTWIIFTTA